MSTWRELITNEMARANDTWENVIRCTLTDEELDVEFDDDYGGCEGVPFYLWTKQRVYFAVAYDGAEWVGSVPRSPKSTEAPYHFGGY